MKTEKKTVLCPEVQARFRDKLMGNVRDITYEEAAAIQENYCSNCTSVKARFFKRTRENKCDIEKPVCMPD